MKKCTLSDFKEMITPWLSSDYLRKVFKDDKGHIVLLFTDGIKDAYHIEECTEDEFTRMLEELRENGIEVEN